MSHMVGFMGEKVGLKLLLAFSKKAHFTTQKSRRNWGVFLTVNACGFVNSKVIQIRKVRGETMPCSPLQSTTAPGSTLALEFRLIFPPPSISSCPVWQKTGNFTRNSALRANANLLGGENHFFTLCSHPRRASKASKGAKTRESSRGCFSKSPGFPGEKLF